MPPKKHASSRKTLDELNAEAQAGVDKFLHGLGENGVRLNDLDPPSKLWDKEPELWEMYPELSDDQARLQEDEVGREDGEAGPSSAATDPTRTREQSRTGTHNTADNPRIPYPFIHLQYREVYRPVVRGKWWSPEYWNDAIRKESRYHHICRIMETTLGEQVFGAERCQHCRSADLECWRYDQRQIAEPSRPGQACARCRMFHLRCCSFATTAKKERERSAEY